MSFALKSTLETISSQVFAAKTADEAKTIFFTFLEDKQIKQRDKDTMLRTIPTLMSLYQVQKYFTNCLLKFEGLSLTPKEGDVKVEVVPI